MPPGRNEPCACGSGRKYKACCLNQTASLPVAPDALIERGFAQIGLKRHAEAILILRQAIAMNSALVLAHIGIGLALKGLERLEEAETAFRQALNVDPGSAVAHHNLGELFRHCGRLKQAQECYDSALRLDPRAAPSVVGLGNVLVMQGEFQAAAERYRQVLAASPDSAVIYGNLAIALKGLGDGAGALEAYRQAVATDPRSAQAHQQLAIALLERDRIEEAIGMAREAIALQQHFPLAHTTYAAALMAHGEPDAAIETLRKALSADISHGQCLVILGTSLLDVGLTGPALDCFRQSLQHDPENATAHHFMAALSGLNPEHPAVEYVRTLFDGYAGNFDRSLVGELAYCVPRELIESLGPADGSGVGWDLLDLGCGTGLIGKEVTGKVQTLVGVDLSEKMIDRARERRVYTRLVCTDLMSALRAELPTCYDVVTAADVFIYVGKLDLVLPAVHRVLRPGGLFAFSAEAAEDCSDSGKKLGYSLSSSGRYVHSADYLTQLAQRIGFHVKMLRKIRLRFDNSRPVVGWITLWGA